MPSANEIVIIGSGNKLPRYYLVEIISNRSLMLFIALEVLISAAWVESSFGAQAFSRSGGILTLLALLALWQWVGFSERRSRLQMTLDHLTLYKYSYSEDSGYRAWRDGGYGSLSGQSAENYFNLRHDIVPHNLNYVGRIESGLARVQVELAMIGTFVLTFGDLISDRLI